MNKLFTTIAITLSATLSIYAQSDTKSIEIIKKSIDAIGGKEKLENVKTLYTEMQINNDPVFYITKEKAPNKGALEVKVNENSVYGYRFDGNNGFEFSEGQIKQMPKEELFDKINRKHIINELAYLDPTIWTFTYLGQTKINNKKVHQLKGKNENGIVEYVYFDSKDYLKVRNEKLIDNDENKKSIIDYYDYRNVDGVNLYFRFVVTDPDKTVTTMTFSKQVINNGVIDNDFVY